MNRTPKPHFRISRAYAAGRPVVKHYEFSGLRQGRSADRFPALRLIAPRRGLLCARTVYLAKSKIRPLAFIRGGCGLQTTKGVLRGAGWHFSVVGCRERIVYRAALIRIVLGLAPRSGDMPERAARPNQLVNATLRVCARDLERRALDAVPGCTAAVAARRKL
jgi:hypothetical protein